KQRLRGVPRQRSEGADLVAGRSTKKLVGRNLGGLPGDIQQSHIYSGLHPGKGREFHANWFQRGGWHTHQLVPGLHNVRVGNHPTLAPACQARTCGEAQNGVAAAGDRLFDSPDFPAVHGMRIAYSSSRLRSRHRLYLHQNANLNANWICRLERCVDAMVPAPPTPTVEFGSPNCGWLSPLKNSDRNCSSFDSPILNFFAKEKSRLKSDGARSVLRPSVPH